MALHSGCRARGEVDAELARGNMASHESGRETIVWEEQNQAINC